MNKFNPLLPQEGDLKKTIVTSSEGMAISQKEQLQRVPSQPSAGTKRSPERKTVGLPERVNALQTVLFEALILAGVCSQDQLPEWIEKHGAKVSETIRRFSRLQDNEIFSELWEMFGKKDKKKISISYPDILKRLKDQYGFKGSSATQKHGRIEF